MKRLASLLAQLRRDESGNVFILVGLFLFILLGVIGLGLNMGNSTILQGRMQNAADSAALAGAIVENGTAADRERAARRYFALNLPDNYLGTDLTAQNVAVDATDTSVKVDTVHTRDSELMKPLYKDEDAPKLTVGAHSLVANTDSPQDVDLVMLMDASGSMLRTDMGGGTRVDGAHDAAQIVIDGLLPKARNSNRIAWVDYTAYCYYAPAWYVNSRDYPPRPVYDCNTYRTNSNQPGYRSYLNSPGFNSSNSPVTKANRDYLSTVKAHPNGTSNLEQSEEHHASWFQTNGTDALRESVKLMNASPRPQAVKAVVYMTDGLNNIDQNKFYRNTGSAPNYVIDTQMRSMTIDECRKVKRTGAILFTVGFSESACSPSGKSLLEECATDKKYYYCTKTTDELKAAFQDMVKTVRNIRIRE